MKHTPGPWTFKRSKEDNNLIGFFVYAATTGDLVISLEPDQYGYGKEQEAEANAKLIAAAPELLEALKSITASMKAHPDNEPNSEFEDMVNTAESAIKKATL